MGWWNKLSLKAKFISGIAIVMLVTVASVILSGWTFRNLQKTTDNLYANMELNQLVLTLEGNTCNG